MCIKRKRVSVPTFDGKNAVFVYYVVADDWLFLQLWNRFVLKIHDLPVCDLLNLCICLKDPVVIIANPPPIMTSG